mmetsp:Transcript_15141/g.25665  ORF Transcript_15141/g.25665 Transcript_15141/m.25665 type:complete len:114 (+) Transcript_15141:547-888(+)
METQLRELREQGKLNAINLYMLGVLLKKKNNAGEARDVLIQALNKMPLLWSAWLELAPLIGKAQVKLLDKLRNHWVKNFYLSSYLLDAQQGKDAFDISHQLIQHFPNSVFLMS